MTENITVIGNIASEPRRAVGASGVVFTTFRLAGENRRFDRASGVWTDGPPNWFTLTVYRQLAEHAYASLRQGDRVIAQGRLRVRPWVDGEKRGTAVEVDVDALGPELRWGTTTFRRDVPGGSGDAESPDEWAVPGESAPSEEGELAATPF